MVAEQHRLVCFKKKDIAVDKFNVASRRDFEAAVQAIGTGRGMRNANVAGHRTGRENSIETSRHIRGLLLWATGCPDVSIAQGVSIGRSQQSIGTTLREAMTYMLLYAWILRLHISLRTWSSNGLTCALRSH